MKELLKAKSEFRKKGVSLISDKKKDGMGGSWKFASEDNFIKTIQEPLSSCGLELFATMDYSEALSVDMVVVTLYHIDTGANIASKISLPTVTPRKDKNGNEMYLDAEIERGKQFGYWSRILSIRLLGLSDIDPEDVNNRMDNISKEPITVEQANELNALIKSADGVDVEAFLKFAQATNVEGILASVYPKVKAALLKKQPKAA